MARPKPRGRGVPPFVPKAGVKRGTRYEKGGKLCKK